MITKYALLVLALASCAKDKPGQEPPVAAPPKEQTVPRPEPPRPAQQPPAPATPGKALLEGSFEIVRGKTKDQDIVLGELLTKQLDVKWARIVLTFEADKITATTQLLELEGGDYLGCVAKVTTPIEWSATGYTIQKSVTGGADTFTFQELTSSHDKYKSRGCNSNLDAGTVEVMLPGDHPKLKRNDEWLFLERTELKPDWKNYVR